MMTGCGGRTDPVTSSPASFPVHTAAAAESADYLND